MRLCLRILKTLPAVVVVALFTLWALSSALEVGIAQNVGEDCWMLSCRASSMTVTRISRPTWASEPIWTDFNPNQLAFANFVGHFAATEGREADLRSHSFTAPIPLLITMLLPLAFGPYLQFRVSLLLAHISLVACEMCYYAAAHR